LGVPSPVRAEKRNLIDSKPREILGRKLKEEDSVNKRIYPSRHCE